MTPDPIRHPVRPCRECPWRRDSPTGKFTAERYRQLANTAGRPGAEVGLDAPIFACHMTREGHASACAGWLATCGHDHLGIRYALALGRLEPAALYAGPDWPALYDSYDELAEANGTRVPEPAHYTPSCNPGGTMSNRLGDRVTGFCPMGCGQTLYVDDAGEVTCSLIECPDPTAVSTILSDSEVEHVVTFSAAGYTIRHPLRERRQGQLQTCDVLEFVARLTGPPYRPGQVRLHHTEAGSWEIAR